ncbi:MAG: acetate kinase [Armatimonadaceae bacterium]
MSDAQRTFLMLNPGSGTLKYALFRVDGDVETPLTEGVVDRKGEAGHRASPVEAVRTLIEEIAERFGVTRPDAVVCRVVMGGSEFREPARVNSETIEAIRRLEPLAPLHNPASRETLEACQNLLPESALFAVFDTTFHATLPPVAYTYALPYELCARHGLRRYGFHGIAHRWVSLRLREHLIGSGRPSGRSITAHFGGGASMCAIREGISIDTSMGLTPLEGLVMATRSGDVDPGLLMYLQKAEGLSPEDMETLLNRQSGLLGISGISDDVRDLEPAAQQGSDRATLAMEVYGYRAAKTIGAYAVALEGVDGIAFSGGLGENNPAMRERICRPLRFLGVELDPERNARGLAGSEAVCISTESSAVAVWIIHADENRQMVRDVLPLLAKA